MRRFIHIMLVIALLTACEKRQLDDCITSAGPERSETREVEPFRQISLKDKFDVVLVQSDSLPESVTLTGGMNLFPGIDTRVENGVLTIEDKNTCNFVRSFKDRIKVVIRLRDIDRINIESVVGLKTEGFLTLENLEVYHIGLEDVSLDLRVANEIYLQTLNSGALILKGHAKKIKGSVEEISMLDARFLACEEALIDSHTRLDCFVNPSEILFVKIYNSGNIWYVREPATLKEINVHKGSGDLLKL